MLYFLGHSFFKLLFEIVFRRKVVGAENIPQDGPVLICANHQSFIDPPLVGSAVKRTVHYLARHDLFTVPVLGWFLTRVHAFPVKRSGGGDPAAFKNIFRRLEEKEIIVLFPEGTRSRDGNLQKPLPGVGLIAYRARVPVIPCYVYGSREVLPRGSWFLHFHPLIVTFGKPIDFSAYYQREKSKDLYREMSAKIMSEIATLKAPSHD
ncbi:MAG: 1-acyl-sn-glycerol-3-phosphate acyltransferase [Elusimicrobia bacterium]|nr:1-acyl-sn-glycerol-3-phosphate acyltransferase [Elusimicrobiota bacterium]